MPEYTLAPATVREAFRKDLPRPQQQVFNLLVDHLELRAHDLTWYHRLGGLVRKFAEQDPNPKPRMSWVNVLAAKLDPCAALFGRACVRRVLPHGGRA
jgi:hypothetical protein